MHADLKSPKMSFYDKIDINWKKLEYTYLINFKIGIESIKIYKYNRFHNQPTL